jgi:DNA-binding MarR family transcriptional regulator
MISKLCKIRDIQHAINRYETEFEKLYGICLNEGMVLCSLSETDHLSSGELGELLGLTPSNTSKVIASVEKKKLIRRVMGKTDKRQMYFLITDKGRACIDSIRCDNSPLPEILKGIVEE